MGILNPCLALISLVTALAVLLPTGVGGGMPAIPAGSVTALSGQATVRRADGPSRPLKVGDVVYWGDIVETAKDGRTRVTFKGNTTVTVRELSRIHVREESGPKGARYTVELLRAQAGAAVDRALMRQAEPEQGRARNAVASVRG